MRSNFEVTLSKSANVSYIGDTNSNDLFLGIIENLKSKMYWVNFRPQDILKTLCALRMSCRRKFNQYILDV